MTYIAASVRRILAFLPASVDVVAVSKGRTLAQVREAVDAGIHTIGVNYVRDVRTAVQAADGRANVHFIGRLRPHDVRASTLASLEMIQTVDSLVLAERIDARCRALGRVIPILIEINSGREPQKGGVMREQAIDLIRAAAALDHVTIVGLMTMGPACESAEQYRPYFRETRTLFEAIAATPPPGVRMHHLSMGMSDSYEVAVEEGATMVRLGRVLFDKPVG